MLPHIHISLPCRCSWVFVTCSFLALTGKQGCQKVFKWQDDNEKTSWRNSHQRYKSLRAEESRDTLKFKVSEMAFPGALNRYFPPWTPCCFVRIHSRLGTMPSKCPKHSTTSHGSNVSQIQTCLKYVFNVNLETDVLKSYSMVLFFVSSCGRRRSK